VPRVPDTDDFGDDHGAGRGFLDRLGRWFLKPKPQGSGESAEVAPPPSVEELEDANRYADDKERLIGLLAAPFAAIIAILIVSAKLSNNPETLKGGKHNSGYTPPTTLHELLIVLLALALVMLATAWFRKRLYLGMATALYGLAVFNLRFWGFGVPFVMIGAWYLVRAYRAQRALREATGEGRRSGGGKPGSKGSAPRPSKRYTPPTAKPKRPLPPGADGEQKAG
jgi:hypothetical protein